MFAVLLRHIVTKHAKRLLLHFFIFLFIVLQATEIFKNIPGEKELERKVQNKCCISGI